MVEQKHHGYVRKCRSASLSNITNWRKLQSLFRVFGNITAPYVHSSKHPFVFVQTDFG